MPELQALGGAEVTRLERAIAAASRRHHLTYQNDDGQEIIIPLMTAPVVLTRADVAYVQKLCLTLASAFRKVCAARARGDAEVRELLPLEPEEEKWLALAPRRQPAPLPGLVARWDLNIDPRPGGGGARAAMLYELNGCAVGGIHYGFASSRIVKEVVGPRLPARAGLPDSIREVWLGMCRRLAAAHRRKLGRMVWLEDRSWDSGITEGPTLMQGLGAVADPRELELARGRIVHRGKPIDIVYRSIELRDLVEMERAGARLDALREAFRRGLVLSPPEGDLDHKSLLEVFSSPAYWPLFSERERLVLARHVPWTRLLVERRCDAPPWYTASRNVDLGAFTRSHREKLVIKPTRACGGEGVTIGWDTTQAAWEKALARALDGRTPSVVQDLVPGAPMETVRVKRGRAVRERHFTNYGVIASPDGVGFLGRAAPFPVVNVSRGGGLVGVLVSP